MSQSTRQKSTTTIYDHDAARFIILYNKNTNFVSAAQKQFEDLNKAVTYKYTWDATKLEKDHAMEVQHVIKMLGDTGYHDDVRWAQATLTSVLHLGYYLNDRRNLWSIPAGLNRLKKCIPLRNWYLQGAWMVGKVNYLEATIAQKGLRQRIPLCIHNRGRPHAVHRALGPQRRGFGSSEDGDDVADESCRDGNLQPTHWAV